MASDSPLLKVVMRLTYLANQISLGAYFKQLSHILTSHSRLMVCPDFMQLNEGGYIKRNKAVAQPQQVGLLCLGQVLFIGLAVLC